MPLDGRKDRTDPTRVVSEKTLVGGPVYIVRLAFDMLVL
jgi:hypothetical protein